VPGSICEAGRGARSEAAEPAPLRGPQSEDPRTRFHTPIEEIGTFIGDIFKEADPKSRDRQGESHQTRDLQAHRQDHPVNLSESPIDGVVQTIQNISELFQKPEEKAQAQQRAKKAKQDLEKAIKDLKEKSSVKTDLRQIPNPRHQTRELKADPNTNTEARKGILKRRNWHY